MAENWITGLWESVFPKKQKYNIDELRAGMARYVTATFEPAPKKPAEKRPQSTMPIPKKPEKNGDAAKHSARKFPQQKPEPGSKPAQYSMREGQADYKVPGQERPAQYSEREPHVQFQMWREEDPVPGLLRSSLNDSEAKALDIILDGRKEKTFTDRLLELIKDRRVTDSHVYKKAQLDRRLFSKIAGDRYYKPAKDTVLALALALECSLEEADDLLERAGFRLSHSSKRDIMIEYLFKEKIYDLTTANIILDQLKQKPIGR